MSDDDLCRFFGWVLVNISLILTGENKDLFWSLSVFALGGRDVAVF